MDPEPARTVAIHHCGGRLTTAALPCVCQRCGPQQNGIWSAAIPKWAAHAALNPSGPGHEVGMRNGSLEKSPCHGNQTGPSLVMCPDGGSKRGCLACMAGLFFRMRTVPLLALELV